MNRREFVKISAAFSSLLGLPSWAPSSNSAQADLVNIPPSTVIRLRIGVLATEAVRKQNRIERLVGLAESAPNPPGDENNYWADAIEVGGRFYYRAQGVTLDIAEWEFHKVVSNPNLHYFSTALRLHNRIRQVKVGEPITI